MRPIVSYLKPVLSVAAGGYYALQKLREKTYDWGVLSGDSAPVPVISVGNILLGGSGKTPFAIYLGQQLHARGLRPAVVSRGYGGSNREPFLIVGDGSGTDPRVDASVCGDEPYLIARRLPNIPVIIGRKRIDPAKAASELFGCGAIVLDDGFQHLPLRRDADIVLLSGSEDRMFPLGWLREPLSALKRAQLIVLTGESHVLSEAAAGYVSQVPVFHCRVVPEALEIGASPGDMVHPSEYAGREVVLFSAIAHPERFRQTAEELGWVIKHHRIFPDHHVLTDEELKDVAETTGDTPMVCTEKDWVKLPARFKEKANVAVLRIHVVVVEEGAFWQALLGLIGRSNQR